MLLLLLSRFHDTGRKPSRSVNDQPLPSMETYPYRHSPALTWLIVLCLMLIFLLLRGRVWSESSSLCIIIEIGPDHCSHTPKFSINNWWTSEVWLREIFTFPLSDPHLIHQTWGQCSQFCFRTGKAVYKINKYLQAPAQLCRCPRPLSVIPGAIYSAREPWPTIA